MGKARGDKIVMWLVWSVQGGWEDDKSVEEAACSEAFEEAGVKGTRRTGQLRPAHL
jgi:8-oxo-dGTP pyrophosphatase MutT (NUDIX family)